MSSPSVISGHRADGISLAMRLPGAPPPQEVAAVPIATPAKVQAPAAPLVSYDPGKLRENLQAAIEHLNKQLASSGRSLGFSMDSVVNCPVVTVRSTQTGEVIRQIPSEAVIRVAHTLDQLKGLLHDAVI